MEYIGRVEHRVFVPEHLMLLTQVLAPAEHTGPQSGEAVGIDTGLVAIEPHILGSRRGKEDVVVEVKETVTQTRYAPQHGRDGQRIEGRQILFVTAKEHGVVNQLDRYRVVGKVASYELIYMGILVVGYDVYLAHPRSIA
jgi:hypothetical protein